MEGIPGVERSGRIGYGSVKSDRAGSGRVCYVRVGYGQVVMVCSACSVGQGRPGMGVGRTWSVV